MTRKYLADLESDVRVTVPKATYTVEVADARSSDTSSGGKMVWLDLKIIGGPDDGTIVSTGVNLPRDGEPGVYYLQRKLRGFNPQIVGAGAVNKPDEEQADVIAEAIKGVRVEADLSLQTGGQYAGTQQLDETRQIVNVTPAARPVAVQTETVVNAGTNNEPPTDPPF